MSYTIKKVGVVGSGTMGSGIAALLVGIGYPVVLLDLPARDSCPGDPAPKRNAIVLDNLERLKKSRIPAFFDASDVERIRVGNTEDDLALLAEVLARLAVKRVEGDHARVERGGDDPLRAVTGGGGIEMTGNAATGGRDHAVHVDLRPPAPAFLAGGGIERDDVVVWRAESDQPVSLDRYGLECGHGVDLGAGAEVVGPGYLELADIGRRDVGGW